MCSYVNVHAIIYNFFCLPCSPTYTGGSHTASVQPSSVPHQTAASGEEYAVTAKVNTTTKSSHHPTEEYAMVDKNKKHAAATQGVSYVYVLAINL